MAKLILSSPLWRTQARRQILDKAVQQSGAELESLVKQKILNSTPAGKVYRRGAITRPASQKNVSLGLRRVSGNSKRVIVGSKFHRASARGQAPAVDSGGLLNSIRAKRRGIMSVVVATSKRYAVRLDDPQGLNRPFFQSTARDFKPKFKQNIADAIRENS